MRKQYRSALMASIHETAEGLHAASVMDKRTMREFDELCLTPVRPLKPKEIRALRLREGASQACFAEAALSGRQERAPSGRVIRVVTRRSCGFLCAEASVTATAFQLITNDRRNRAPRGMAVSSSS